MRNDIVIPISQAEFKSAVPTRGWKSSLDWMGGPVMDDISINIQSQSQQSDDSWLYRVKGTATAKYGRSRAAAKIIVAGRVFANCW